MAVVCQVIEDRQSLAEFEPEWDPLLTRSSADCIFLTWQWVNCWLDAVAPSARLMTITARDEAGRLIGVAPFYVGRMRLLHMLTYRACRPIGDPDSGAEYPDLLLDPNDGERARTAIFETLRQQARRWDVLWVPRLADWTGASDNLLAGCGQLNLLRRVLPHAFSAIRLPADYETYLNSLPKKRRAMLRQRTRALLDAGAEFEICRDPGRLPGLLDEFFDLHRRRWQTRGQVGAFHRRPAMARFYRQFAPIALEHGWLRLYSLRIGRSRPAMQLGYVYRNVYSAMQEGFDPDGPAEVGNVLRAMSIRSLIEEGVTCYDFLGGDSQHKRLWRAETQQGVDAFLGRRTLKNRLLFGVGIWPRGRYMAICPPSYSASV